MAWRLLGVALFGVAWLWLGGILSTFGAQPAPTSGLQTSVPHVILIDADTESILFQKGADDSVAPASTTKIMTADMVFEALKAGKIKLTDEFKVSENAWRNGGAPAHGSTMFAALHSSVPIEDLIRGLLIVSGNDAAIVLAEGLAGSEGAFATKMTERAHELGFTHLTFTNAWGRDDPDQRVTARDMALLAAHVIKTFPDYYHYFGEKDFTWNKIKQPNRDPLLASDIGADGLKTGYIDAQSGYSIVASAVQNGERLILAMYGAKTAKERADEAARILQWGFRSFEARTIFAKGEVIGSARVYGGSKGRVLLVTTKEVTALIPRDLTEKITGRIVYMGPLSAPIVAGVEVAQLKIFLGTTEILDVPLATAENIGKGNLPSRAMDAALEYVGDQFRKYILKAVNR